MRRRTLLSAVGLAAPATLLTSLDEALASAPTGSPVPLGTRLAAARAHFDAGHNTKLLKVLPGLFADAHHAARSSRAELTRLLLQ